MNYFEELENSTVCEYCGGTGIVLIGARGNFKSERCICSGRPRNGANLDVTDTWLSSHIPNKNFQTPFDAEKIECVPHLHPSLIHQFKHYKLSLTQIMQGVLYNQELIKNYFICAPNGYGKRHFAYAFMLNAYKRGLKPSPLYSLWELTQYINNQKYIVKLLDCDIFFISNTMTFTEETVQMLKLLLDLCEMRGISVILISREGVDRIVNVDKEFDYKIFSPNSATNSYSDGMEYVYLPSTFRKTSAR